MTSSFEVDFQNELTLFNQFLQSWIKKYQKSVPHKAHKLVEALKYALVGGKRFRPLFSILTAKTFKQDVESVLPYACAIEFLHTYSLIHDDLPAMDNADSRRSRASLHKAFNEAIAILTGDALLTEAFALAVSCKSEFLKDTASLIQLLAESSGGRGMISGQILDLQAADLQAADPQAADLQAVDLSTADSKESTSVDLEQLYELKTGALISAAVVGAAMFSGATKPDILKLKGFAQKLGIAFQIADDIEDFEKQGDEKSAINCVHQWGIQTAQNKLQGCFNQSLDILKSIENTRGLQKLVRLHFKKHF